VKITRRGLLTGVGLTAVAGLGATAYGVAIEPSMVRIAEYRPQPKNWPADFPLRIVALSDVHANEPWLTAERLKGICERANALEPDIILLLGDYRSGMRRFSFGEVPVADWAEMLKLLQAPLGVHAIMGNHDYWDDEDAMVSRSGPTNAQRGLESVGIPVYLNRAARLEKEGRGFWLAGLDDLVAFVPLRHARDYDGPEGLDDLPGTLAQLTTDEPAILMSHVPDIFPQVPDRIALTLSGHTHGGQVRILGYSPVVPSMYGNRYAYGHVVEDDRHLIVSSGLGFSKLPVRIGIPPEIMLIELGSAA
jgi:predicted MPP superfamily phosphohydrolase